MSGDTRLQSSPPDNEARLRARIAELEQQLRARDEFLSIAGHELKTPLTAVREGAELLRDRVGGELSPAQQEIVRIVRENTLSLQKLIEDLLNYHQTRSMEPQTLGPVALEDVIRRVAREHKLAAFARMITFEAKLTSAIVIGDVVLGAESSVWMSSIVRGDVHSIRIGERTISARNPSRPRCSP